MKHLRYILLVFIAFLFLQKGNENSYVSHQTQAQKQSSVENQSNLYSSLIENNFDENNLFSNEFEDDDDDTSDDILSNVATLFNEYTHYFQFSSQKLTLNSHLKLFILYCSFKFHC